jgi:EAL domain-containing protein (putative c-di-GMP-specific phosphodiesterase class I)
VNLFPAQFRGGDLPDLVQDVLSRHDLPPSGLELEITENIILAEQELILAQLNEIGRLGVALSFDDFGTGYASLNLLRSFPIGCIKIDKGFIQLMRTSEKDRIIVVGIIDMAQKLGLRVVAEGIESSEDWDFLRMHRCDKGQGYFFGKPVPASIFAERFLMAPVMPRVHAALSL